METEITVQVFDSLKDINFILLQKGFCLKEKVFMQDWYFSKFSTKELNEFDYPTLIKNSFIVRKVVDNETNTFICYKNKVWAI